MQALSLTVQKGAQSPIAPPPPLHLSKPRFVEGVGVFKFPSARNAGSVIRATLLLLLLLPLPLLWL